MTAFTFFCDESGNSGPNYIDPAQPFYVTAGWLVPDAAVASASDAVVRIRQEWSPQTLELKSTSVLRRRNGLECVRALVQALGRLGALPVFSVAEKRYCTAAKIVDTYLDPIHNPLLAKTFTCDVTTKRQLANDLCQLLSRDTLNAFAQAYRNAEPAALGAALDLIISEAAATIGPEVASLLTAARPQLREIADAEGWQAGGDQHGINLPVLVSLFQLLERIGRSNGLQVTKFVHDESATHEEVYHRTFQTYKAVGEQVLRMPLSDVSMSGLHAVKEFAMVRSKDTPLVQAADLYSGAINAACRHAENAIPLRPEQVTAYSLLLSPLVISLEPPLAWATTSDAFLRRLADLLKWTKGAREALPHSGPRSVLPAAGSGRAPIPGPRVTFPAAPWILREADGRPILVRCAFGDEGRSRSVLPVFSDSTAAQAFVAAQLPGDHARATLAGDTPHDLLQVFERLAATVPPDTLIAVDPTSADGWRLTPLSQVASSLRELMSRAARAAATGLMPLVRQEHQVDGLHFVTLLLATGEYGAQLAGAAEVVTAPTRAAALERAVARARASRGSPPGADGKSNTDHAGG